MKINGKCVLFIFIISLVRPTLKEFDAYKTRPHSAPAQQQGHLGEHLSQGIDFYRVTSQPFHTVYIIIQHDKNS